MPFTRAPNCATAPPRPERKTLTASALRVKRPAAGGESGNRRHERAARRRPREARGEGRGDGLDVLLARRHDGHRAPTRAKQADAVAPAPAGPGFLEAGGAGDDEDRQLASPAFVVDVGGEAVDERTVASAHEPEPVRPRGERREHRAAGLEPAADPLRVRAPAFARHAAGAEAVGVIPGQLPGDEGGQAPPPQEESGEGGRERKRPAEERGARGARAPGGP